MSECERLGLQYGVYWYSTATTDAEANAEADALLEKISGRNPSFGVFVDVEATRDYENAGINAYDEEGRELINWMARIIINRIREAGYTAGIYANTDYYSNILYVADYDSEIRWMARYFNYTDDHNDQNACPSGDWDIW
jgi:hypothetical protein